MPSGLQIKDDMSSTAMTKSPPYEMSRVRGSSVKEFDKLRQNNWLNHRAE